MLLLSSLLLLQSLMISAFCPGQVTLLSHGQVSLRQSASDTPVEYVARKNEAAAFWLEERCVDFAADNQLQTCPRPFMEVWEWLRAVLHNSRNQAIDLPSADEALARLKAPMLAAYSDETKFEEALFDALRQCLTAYELVQAEHSSTIVLNLGDSQEYAVGIALQKPPQGRRVRDHMFLKSHYTSTELDAKSIPGHAVCLCHNERSNWSVTDCFSVVKLETSDSACENFDLRRDGTIRTPDLSSAHSALGQAILLNLGCVLYQAKMGVLGDHIPLAVIAATNKGGLKGHSHEKVLRWVSARLEVPKAFGWGFEYSIQNYGHFSKKNDDESIEQALSVYIETILSGLVAAINVQKKLAAGEIPQSVPASGQALMIGNLTRNQLHLWASPIPGAVTWQASSASHRWIVSQGELFKGKLDVKNYLQNSRLPFYDLCAPVGSSDVLVKVSSPAVHHLLIRPGDAYEALNVIKRYGTEGLVNQISSVLYAAVYADPGLVTIMRDLTQDGYGALKPIDYRDELDVLWGGFQDLVVRTLLPMAELTLPIVHADIRPGYDVTSNILCKVERGTTGVKKATMKLIDMDSLVSYSMMRRTAFLDDRYIKKERGWDATTYVWWQCMSVAYVWKESLNGDRLRKESSLAHMKHILLKGSLGPAWLRKYRDRAKGNITAEIVMLTLKDLAEEFATNQKASLPQVRSASGRKKNVHNVDGLHL